VETLSGKDTLSWTDTSRTSGSKYYYRIRTRTKLDSTTYRSEPSNEAMLIRLSRPSIKNISQTDDGFTLTWSRVSGAAGYEVYRSTDGGEAELLAVIGSGKTLEFTDHTAAETGKTYTYSVAARKEAGEQVHLSAVSSKKSAVHPEAPFLLTMQKTSKGLRLRWEPAEQATGYDIYRSTNGTKWTRVKTISDEDTLSWTDTNCKRGTRYYYRIRTRIKLSDFTYRSEPSNEEQLRY